MFTVYHSNDIEILVRLGIHLMKSSATGNSSGNPFNPFHFIVQSNGMELYLKQKIADIEGVCARIECQLCCRPLLKMTPLNLITPPDRTVM